MKRPNNKNLHFRAALGLLIVVCLGAARTEKIWAETLNGLDLAPLHVSLPDMDHEAFDPARVPQSGGMASRLLSGIAVRHA